MLGVLTSLLEVKEAQVVRVQPPGSLLLRLVYDVLEKHLFLYNHYKITHSFIYKPGIKTSFLWLDVCQLVL
jgi:membrane-bound metal-dependent hydrolase YbcI (DUF457 family)